MKNILCILALTMFVLVIGFNTNAYGQREQRRPEWVEREIREEKQREKEERKMSTAERRDLQQERQERTERIHRELQERREQQQRERDQQQERRMSTAERRELQEERQREQAERRMSTAERRDLQQERQERTEQIQRDLKERRVQMEQQRQQRDQQQAGQQNNALEIARQREREWNEAARRVNPNSIDADRIYQQAARASVERRRLEQTLRQQQSRQQYGYEVFPSYPRAAQPLYQGNSRVGVLTGLNLSEKFLYAQNMNLSPVVRKVRAEAYQEADKRFPNPIREDTDNDAFRHAYASAILARNLGAYNAKLITDAHERITGNPPLRKNMDLYNNSVGIGIGSLRKLDGGVYRPLTDREIGDMVEQSLRQNELRILRR